MHRRDVSRKARRAPPPKGSRAGSEPATAAGGQPGSRGRTGLARWISKLGFASRTDAARLIRAGRVSVDGAPARDPERPTDPRLEAVAVDGRPLAARERLYYAMHKPVGPVTTWSDPEGRATVYDLLPPFDAWIFPVGRLDAQTSGLLLFTNDAALADALAGDRSRVAKRYEVAVRGALPDAALEALRAGVTIARRGPVGSSSERGDDGSSYRTLPARVERLSPSRVAIEIVEGKNRQVRRMLAAVGRDVVALARTQIGPLALGDLPEGATRALSAEEVAALRAAAARA